MKKKSSRVGTTINTFCVTAFAAVSLSVAMPGIACAGSMAGDSGDAGATGTAVFHPFGMEAVGAGGLPQGVVARVNGVDIPAVQVDNALHASRQPDTPRIRQAITQDLIVHELFRQNAEKAHYDTKPEVQEVVNAAKVNAETQLYLRDNLRPESVTDAQVKARYDEIVASLGKEEFKPRIIAVADEATANTVIVKLKAGSAFDAIARQYSVAPSKGAGGELAWVSFRTPVAEGKTQGLPLPIAQALTQLPIGAVTPTAIPVVEGNSTTRVIVKLDAKRPTQVPTFDQTKDTIRQQLQTLVLQKAAIQFSATLLKDASVQQ